MEGKLMVAQNPAIPGGPCAKRVLDEQNRPAYEGLFRVLRDDEADSLGG